MDSRLSWAVVVKTVTFSLRGASSSEWRKLDDTTGWNYIGTHLKFTLESKESIKKHWPDASLLPRDAFETIHGKRGTWDSYTMASALSDNMMAQVNLGSDLTIDEIIFETAINDLACSTIPRKPHSKGIWEDPDDVGGLCNFCSNSPRVEPTLFLTHGLTRLQSRFDGQQLQYTASAHWTRWPSLLATG